VGGVAGAGGVEVAGAGGGLVAGAGGAVVAGAGGGDSPGAGGVEVAGAGGGLVAGAGGAVVAGAGGGDSPGAGGVDSPGAGAAEAAGTGRAGVTGLLGETTTGATPTDDGAGIVTICPAVGCAAVGCVDPTGEASAVRAGLALAGAPSRCPDVSEVPDASATPGGGGGRSVGSAGPDAVDCPSSGPIRPGSVVSMGCPAQAPAMHATAATSAARRAVSVMHCEHCESRARAVRPGTQRRGSGAWPAAVRSRAPLRDPRVRAGPALVRRSQCAMTCPHAPSIRRP
jgi:hypothetical protein